MGGNNFLTILKTITESMKCPTCEHSYELEEVQFISQMEGFSLVHLSCSHCKMPVYVNFFTSEKKPNFKIDYIRDEEFDFEEITTDEVISFHKLLTNFDGNFKKVFKR